MRSDQTYGIEHLSETCPPPKAEWSQELLTYDLSYHELESDISGQSWILLGESSLQHKSLYNQISAIKLLASEGDFG